VVPPGDDALSQVAAGAVAIIPSRIGSVRFPGKMLASQTGRPLVQHVVDQVRQCRLVTDVIVAADDERIAAALAPFGTRVILTSAAHQSGTDRVAEVARSLAEQVIVNVQGDEPEIDPAAVDSLVAMMQRSSAEMGTLATPFSPGMEASDPNLVKVVVGRDGRALYFSRSPIPFKREPPQGSDPLLHIGLYAYRRNFLLKLAQYPPTPLELTEKLEQLRALEYGHTIRVEVVKCRSHGIDTPQQYADFVQRYKQGRSSPRTAD
jgi:3-deoxy-manno-octulosonate cytidylyltransferase (CMP-KDO synthetase)